MTVRQCLLVFLATVSVSLAILMIPAGAQADSLIYTPTPGNQVGQTSNNPCIIGDPSCDTNTKQTFPLPYTSASGPCAGGNCNFTSPVYLASSSGLGLPNIIPTSFDVGVDENVATGQGPEILDHFIVWQCDSKGKNCVAVNDLVSSFTLVDENNGTGWADGVISQITLISGDYYKFQAEWSNDSDGMEQFWIIPGTVSVSAPEPGTLSLFGFGLLGLMAIRLFKVNA
jgi:PEP-CTERM motif